MKNTKFKELRLKYKYTQEDVANILNVSRTAYRRYENGEAEPTYSTLKRIAKLYNVTLDFLLDYDSGDLTVKNLSSQVRTLKREQLVDFINSCLKLLSEVLEESK